MIESSSHPGCRDNSAQIAEHNRRLGDHDQQIAALTLKHDAILRIVTEAKDSQDRACQTMAVLGAQLTAKLETMSNTQHAMQIDATKLSTAFNLDRENQSTKKGDNRWLIGVALSLITAANILIPLIR